ncbi:MAG: DUF2190 family protein [Desulfurellales bacterium]|nr:MAG: DUF2190 family protein [Desulfurellales bacterium]
MKSSFVYDESFRATADYSTKQYYAMKLGAEDYVTLAAAATDRCVGVLQNKPAAAGRGANVRILGITQAISDGSGTAIAVGDYVGPNSSGKMVKKATADYNAMGLALQASSADGTIIRVLLMPGAWFRTAGG